MYREVFFYFLRLGFLGFGGPLAIVASIQHDLVEDRKWIDIQKFRNAFSLIKSMPGPIAFSTAVYMGNLRAGFIGAFLAGFALILPSFFMMLGLTIFLTKYENSSSVVSVMLGMQIGALAVILASLRGLIKGYERDALFWFLVVASIFLNFQFPSSEPLIIIGFGLILALSAFKKVKLLTALLFFTSVSVYGDMPLNEQGQTLLNLISVCFKSGALVFGSGLAIVPLLEQEVVQHYHWLTHSEFLNALALGQVTPGPVVITATAIGYYVAGFWGALLATISIFLAAFVHMSTWFPSAVDYLSKQKWIASFSRGAMAAVLGGIILAVFTLGKNIEWNLALAILGLLALVATATKRIPVWAVIPICGAFIWLKSM